MAQLPQLGEVLRHVRPGTSASRLPVYSEYEVSQLMAGKCLLSRSLESSAQKTRTIRRVFCVTGSDRSPPGGETAPTTEIEPVSAGGGLDAAGPLVELGQPCGQVGGVSFFTWHLFQPGGDLPHGLGPPGGRVGHQGDVVAHVTVVLGDGHSGVDGRLTGRHWHVGGVGDKNGPAPSGACRSWGPPAPGRW